jgi:hypothetical protein
MDKSRAKMKRRGKREEGGKEGRKGDEESR